MKYRQNLEIAWRKINGEVVLIDPSNSQMRQLNAVGGCVWEALERPASVDELVGIVCERFETPSENARTDVETFIGKLLKRSLIEAVP